MQLAAVDLGSNSFRLEIGRVEGSHIARVGYWKETVRLAAGLDGEGRLSRKAIAIAVDTLARMNERLRGIGAEHVRAVGTQTLRQARNVNEFLLEAQDALGYPIEVISGREEARLIFEGCSHELPLTDQPRLVVDIGGASNEMIVGTGFTASSAESFKIGCVNTSLRFFKDGRIDRAALKRAQVAAAAEIEEAVSLFGAANWSEAYGSSGTVGAVSEILRAEGWSDGTITVDGLQRVRGAVLEAGEVGRIRLAGMKPDRQSVIAGGLAVLSAVFDTLGVTAMKPARGGLRVGVLYDLLGRREHKDVRHATV
jgi:exopolyphosphatase / guanosine-5'-triphosphate,3'-diphosphate pyrophosphatase